jgi:hypothetical protein
MSDSKLKRRCSDVKKDAMAHYRDMGYEIIPSNNEIICFSAVDKAGTHERKVRVTIDKISQEDIAIVGGLTEARVKAIAYGSEPTLTEKITLESLARG